MAHAIRSIIGFAASSAFLFASVLNSNLVWNADKFYNEPESFDARLTQMHTGIREGKPYVFEAAKKVNKTELGRFFEMVRN